MQRYLDDEPVEACPPSKVYRMRKFVRRNKLGLFAASAVVLALLVGAGLATWQSVRATQAWRSEQEARKTTQQEQERAEKNLDLALTALDAVYLDAIGRDKLLGEPVAKPDNAGWTESAKQPPLTDLERELLKRGLDFYDRFARQNAVAPRAVVRTAQAYYRVAVLQAALGESEDAQMSYRSAIERFKRLTQKEPANAEHFRELAEAYEGLAECRARLVPRQSDIRRVSPCIFRGDRTETQRRIALHRAWRHCGQTIRSSGGG